MPEASSWIDLRLEPEFDLGVARVRPAVREVVLPGDRVVLQPRVMQVLVALARAQGQIVSRDQLIESCWGGVTVGDDAINRCIGVLRRLAEDQAPGVFNLETIARVGYRMWPASPPAASAPLPQASARVGRLNPAIPLIALVLLAGVIVVAATWRRPTHGARPRLVVLAPWSITPPNPATEVAAEHAVQSIDAGLPSARLVVRAPLKIAARPLSATPSAWVVSGRIMADREPAVLDATVRTLGGAVLWSRRVESDRAHLEQAGERLAAWTSSTLICAVGGPPTQARSDDVWALLMDVCGKYFSGQPEDGGEARSAAARRLAAAAPQDAYAQGILAVSLAMNLQDWPPALSRTATTEVERIARRALALDPHVGDAWLALGNLAWDEGDYARADALFRDGLAAEPDHPSLHNFLGELMFVVGREEEALVFKRRAQARDPGSPIKVVDVALALSRTGQLRAALDLLDRMERARGPSKLLMDTRIQVLLRCGQAAAAVRLLEPEVAHPRLLEPALSARRLQEARGMLNPQGPEAVALVRALPANLADNPDVATLSMVTLSHLGRRRAAAEIALHDTLDPRALFGPDQNWLVSSPEFPTIARRQGLWRYWVQTGHWPDACRTLALPWRCQASG